MFTDLFKTLNDLEREATPKAPPPPVARPEPFSVKHPIDEYAEYQKTATAIGLESYATREAEIMEFMATEGISVYSYHKVDAYLKSEAAKIDSSNIWVWKPLRAVDNRGWAFATKGPREHGQIVPDQYTLAIPLPVLLTVKKFLDRFGSKVVFLVSDIVDPKTIRTAEGDPFLVVVLDTPGNFHIVERWDEPSFRS